MSTKTSLLDLPYELLVRITDLYFQDVKVGLNHLGRSSFPDNAGFSSLMLSCKTLGDIAEKSFFEHAEVFVDTEDMVHFRYSFASCPFVRGMKHTVTSRYTKDNHSILYPVQLFEHLLFDPYAFARLLATDPNQQQQRFRSSFPFLKSLRTECAIRLPYGQRDVEQASRLCQVMSECTNQAIKFSANVEFRRRENLRWAGSHHFKFNKFKCAISEGKILPYKARIYSREFYDNLTYLLKTTFDYELEPLTEDWEGAEPIIRVYAGVEWINITS